MRARFDSARIRRSLSWSPSGATVVRAVPPTLATTSPAGVLARSTSHQPSSTSRKASGSQSTQTKSERPGRGSAMASGAPLFWPLRPRPPPGGPGARLL